MTSVFGRPRVLDDPVWNQLLASKYGFSGCLTVADDDHTVVQTVLVAHESSPEVTVWIRNTLGVELEIVENNYD